MYVYICIYIYIYTYIYIYIYISPVFMSMNSMQTLAVRCLQNSNGLIVPCHGKSVVL